MRFHIGDKEKRAFGFALVLAIFGVGLFTLMTVILANDAVPLIAPVADPVIDAIVGTGPDPTPTPTPAYVVVIEERPSDLEPTATPVPIAAPTATPVPTATAAPLVLEPIASSISLVPTPLFSPAPTFGPTPALTPAPTAPAPATPIPTVSPVPTPVPTVAPPIITPAPTSAPTPEVTSCTNGKSGKPCNPKKGGKKKG